MTQPQQPVYVVHVATSIRVATVAAQADIQAHLDGGSMVAAAAARVDPNGSVDLVCEVQAAGADKAVVRAWGALRAALQAAGLSTLGVTLRLADALPQ